MKKAIGTAMILLLLGFASLPAEQLTTVAVVDLSKIFQAFFRDSQAVREYERLKVDFQKEIDRMNDEIRQIQERKLAADNRGDQTMSLRLEDEVGKKRDYLRDYVNIKNAQLKRMREQFSESSSFSSEMLQAIEWVAMNEGYSVVVNASDQGLVWWSKSVDVTDMVIQRLMQKR